MKYRRFIEDNFLIDEPKTGRLVPFKFRDVQNRYYDDLCRDYDIENRGLLAAVREIVLKARKEGFTSLILGIFAADDILTRDPTESFVISYKDEATRQFRKRYRWFMLSWAARKLALAEGDRRNPNRLEGLARRTFARDEDGNYELRHNLAHFACGTASARTGGRGSTVQKLLFSEAAHYPDLEKMSASEIIEGTLRQMDAESGLAFIESTANGYGNHYEETWHLAEQGLVRFKPRFFGWREFYTPEQFQVIASEFTDKRMLKQEYPETPDEAFLATGSSYFDNDRIAMLLRKAVEPAARGFLKREPEGIRFVQDQNGPLRIWETPDEYKGYVVGGDVAEGIVGGDWSVLRVREAGTGRLVAKWRGQVPPDEFAKGAYLLGAFYNNAYMGVEVNKDGLWVNSELVEMGYPNLHFQELLDEVTRKPRRKYGWKTDSQSRPVMLAELLTAIAETEYWPDRDLLQECLTFVRDRQGRPEAMSGKNDDEIFADAIALMIRHNAPASVKDRPRKPLTDKEVKSDAVQRDIETLSRRQHDEDYGEE